MTGSEAAETLMERIDGDPQLAPELAAARLTTQVEYLLSSMLEASVVNQRQVAERLGVTEGRVSQVLNGDGNIRIAALGRYARALGYTLKFSAEPCEGSALLAERRTRRAPRRLDRATDSAATATESVVVPTGSSSFSFDRSGGWIDSSSVLDRPSNYQQSFALAAFHEGRNEQPA